MTVERLHRRMVLALCLAGGLAACAAEESNEPVNKTLVVTAGPNVNRYNDAANPIVIRLYQLSSRSEFEAAGFWEIFNETDENLAGAIIDKRSLSPLYPEESRLVDLDIETDAYFLAAFAEFADYENQQFRAVVPISNEILDKGVTVSVTASGVLIAYRDSTAILDADGKAKVAEGEPGSLPKFLGKIFGGGE